MTESKTTKWYPIAIAPKDGTQILLYRGISIDSKGRRGRDIKYPMIVGYWGGASWSCCSGNTSLTYPTHWAYLPEAPHVEA